MNRATAVRARDDWSGEPADSVVLDFDDRHRRRITMTGVGGLEFLLDLPDAVALRGGDALMLEDGRLVEVVAAPEALIEIRAKTPGDLVRLAWHIGNRHLPAQVMARALRLRSDHVIEDMLRQLGAQVVAIEAPFDPEGGAYAASSASAHGRHDHGHGHDHHAHEHPHDHGHGHDDHPGDHAHDHR